MSLFTTSQAPANRTQQLLYNSDCHAKTQNIHLLCDIQFLHNSDRPGAAVHTHMVEVNDPQQYQTSSPHRAKLSLQLFMDANLLDVNGLKLLYDKTQQ